MENENRKAPKKSHKSLENLLNSFRLLPKYFLCLLSIMPYFKQIHEKAMKDKIRQRLVLSLVISNVFSVSDSTEKLIRRNVTENFLARIVNIHNTKLENSRSHINWNSRYFSFTIFSRVFNISHLIPSRVKANARRKVNKFSISETEQLKLTHSWWLFLLSYTTSTEHAGWGCWMSREFRVLFFFGDGSRVNNQSTQNWFFK